MRFLPPDEEVIIYESVFEDDLFGRRKVSSALSEVIENIEDPLVIALDGRWGTGKSYFLKRWVGAHNLQNKGSALTLYFDAFEHDYLSDPLFALVGTLASRVENADRPKLDRLKRAAMQFIRPVTRVGLAVASFGVSEAVSGLGDAAVAALKDEANREVENLWKREEGRQAGMEEFHKAISALIHPETQSDPTPLVIVIDELDRCRPDFALELLEVIKHFFSVPHVHFVLGVNMIALENIVKVRYGSDIDATAYLQKFLSFTIQLPADIGDFDRTPATLRYASYIGHKMAVPSHLIKELLNQLEVMIRVNHISMRDVGKIMSALSLLPNEARNERIPAGWRDTMMTLVIVKVVRPDLLLKLVDASISRAELVAFLGANENVVTNKKADGTKNPRFHRKTWMLYCVWMYILTEGVSPNDSEWPNMANYFDQSMFPQDPKTVTRKIQEDWLSTFKLA